MIFNKGEEEIEKLSTELVDYMATPPAWKTYFGIHTMIRENLNFAVYIDHVDYTKQNDDNDRRYEAISEIKQTYTMQLIRDYQRFHVQEGHKIDIAIFTGEVKDKVASLLLDWLLYQIRVLHEARTSKFKKYYQ